MLALTKFADARPKSDVKVMLATFSGGVEASREELIGNRNKVECPVLTVPEGLDNTLVHRLGILAEDKHLNSVLVRKDGRIALFFSGLSGTKGSPLQNTILNEDKKSIEAMLERGEVEAAKAKVMTLAPPYDPEAVDERGRKLRKPKHSTAHLRARAKVYVALKEWDKALADAEEVYSREFSQAGGMSLRTEELDQAEALRDEILNLKQADR